MAKLTVVIPAKNEEANIAELIRRLHKVMTSQKVSYNAIVVDDRSTDKTVNVVKDLSKKYPVHLHKKVGIGGKAYSVLEGARLSDSEFIGMIDADLQYPPEILPELLQIAEEQGVAVGNRTKRNTSKLRQIASKTFKFFFARVLMGMNVDVQSGIKVFRREIIARLSEKDVTPWTLDMPLLHTARELGYSIGSVDMEFLERRGGQSKVRVFKASTEIGLKALRLRFARRKVYTIEPTHTGMIGAGLVHKRNRYITHTTLPHKHSAMRTVTTGQKIVLGLLVTALVVGLVTNPFNAALALVALLSLIYFIDVLFSAFVLLKSLHFPPELRFDDDQLALLDEKSLPTYSILCPLYKEAQILPHFVEAMELIDWPKKKLEILLLLEENDEDTIQAAKNMNLPSHFKIVVVPHSFPKTKPKACNYGLSISTGEYVVIFDAEDKPDPLQLKKVYLAFQKLGKRYGCVQCKLNYFNPTHNLLTCLFTTEYSLWFDVILPGLQSIEGTIPLGGTSNHFRREDLIKLHAWDPFNVTEDCDLGIRLFKNGYKTAIVDSVTYEEANSKVKNWIRQRSRWIKGYFQTYLVHMRNPLGFFAEFGVHALIFQLVIGMRMTFMLINPILWAITIAYFAAYKYVGPTIEALFPPTVFYMAGFALIVGNFMYIYNYMIGAAKRGHWGLIKFVFFIPLYWLLTSIAAVMALWQLITKPHYWEKTNHGLHLKKSKKIESDIRAENLQNKKSSNSFINPIFRYITKNNISAFFLICSAMLANFFGFLYNAYLGRELTPSDFGLISLIGSFLYLVQIVTSGLGRTITYKSANLLGKHGNPVRTFWSRMRLRWTGVAIVFSVLWFISTPLLMRWFNSENPVPFVLFTPVWLIGILGAVDGGFMEGGLRFGFMAATTMVEAVSKFGFAFLFVEMGRHDLVYAAVPLSMVATFFVTWIAILKSNGHIHIPKNSTELKFPKQFFTTSLITKLSSVAFLSFDVLLAKLFLSPTDAGHYALLSLIGKIIYFLGSLFSQFIVPVISSVEGKGGNSGKIFTKIILATALSSFIGFLVVGVFGKYTVPLLFGSKAYDILQYLVIYSLAMVSTTIALNIVTYHQIKNHKIFPLFSLLMACIEVVLMSVFHSNLDVFVYAFIGSCFLQLLILLILHKFHFKFVLISRNLADFLGLFRIIPQANTPLKDNKQRILIYNWRDTNHIWAGGAEIYVHEIAKRWVKDGNQVTVFCGNDGKSKRHEVLDGVNVVRRGGFYTVYLWAFLYYIFRFSGHFDVVIDSENGIPFFTPLYVRIPSFLLIHHVHQEVFREHLKFPFSSIAMFVEKRLMPHVYKNSKIITVSESSKKDIVNLGCGEASNIEIVSPGIDLTLYRTRKKAQFPMFIYLGRLKKYKNINIAISSFALIAKKHPTAKFYIVGDGDAKKALKLLVRDLSLEKRIIFTEHVSDKEKIELLGKSWISIQPSSFEGWGITVIEANACGTPVIASNTNGLRDSVSDGNTGVLVPVKNTEILSRAMSELVKDSIYRKELSKKAYQWAQKFSWDDSSTKFFNILGAELQKSNVLTEFANETYE